MRNTHTITATLKYSTTVLTNMPENEPNDMGEPFSESLPFTEVFGEHPKTKILGAMLNESDTSLTNFSVNEITRITGVDRETFDEHIDDLLDYEIVVEAGEMDDSTMYDLNDGHAIVEDLLEINSDLIDYTAEQTGSE